MPASRSGDIRRRWELRVLIALPAVWVLFAAVEGYLAIQLTLDAVGVEGRSPAVDRVRLLVIGLGSMLALACGTALGLAVTRPMRDLLRKIQHRLRGDAAVGLTGGNELRQLSNAFDDMLLSFDKFVSDSHIVDGMPLGVIVVDRHGVIVRANAEAQRLFPLGPLSGRRIADVCVPAMDRQLAGAIAAVRDTGTPVEVSAAMLLAAPDGAQHEPQHVVSLHPTTAVDEVVIAIRDLGQLASIRGQIQRVDQLAALGAHVASVAHELGGALMGIQTLVDTVEPQDTPDDRRLHGKLQDEVERASRLLAEIRMFGQASARERVRCELTRLVEETMWVLEPRFAHKKLKVERRLAADLPLVVVDRDRIAQAILNVITNAFEATPEGGRIEVVTARATGATTVCVSNSGSFITPEQREKIFTLFYTTKRGGSGFGLSQARRALVDHGGEIEVRSSVETGTTFVLRIPEDTPVADAFQAPRADAIRGALL